MVGVEEEISRLYGLPLEDFTGERNKAARAARKSGQADEADAIDRLRKPSIAAWAINQLARRRRRDVDLVLDSGKRLRDAQRSVLEGRGRRELDQARASLDKAVVRLVAAARPLLQERATDAALGRIGETLHAAAISDDGRELLARGSLTREVRATGWEVFEDLAADLPARAADEATASRETSPSQAAGSVQESREALREAKARRREAARALRDAEREQVRMRRALDAADAEVERARRELRRAEDELAQAERELRGP